MGSVRPYDPKPPLKGNLDITTYPLKLATVTVDKSQKGLKKYRVSVPNEVRARHLSDPIHGGDWRTLIMDFDSKFLIFNWEE